MNAGVGVVAIVEDDSQMRRSLERLLHASGYGTISFASAEDFLEARVVAPFALLLDIHLPGMSGIALRRRLVAAGSRIPVIFITAFDDGALCAEALAAGCVDVLQKPFEATQLAQALERCE